MSLTIHPAEAFTWHVSELGTLVSTVCQLDFDRFDSLFCINHVTEFDCVEFLGNDSVEVDKREDHHVYPSVCKSGGYLKEAVSVETDPCENLMGWPT